MQRKSIITTLIFTIISITTFYNTAYSESQPEQSIALPVLQDISKPTFKFFSKDISGNEISSGEMLSAVLQLIVNTNKYKPHEVKDKRFLFDQKDQKQ